jgi:hypothetical protein
MKLDRNNIHKKKQIWKILQFKPYTGKSATGPSMNGATYDFVMNLMRGFFEKGYNLYCDNYYTSPQLF